MNDRVSTYRVACASLLLHAALIACNDRSAPPQRVDAEPPQRGDVQSSVRLIAQVPPEPGAAPPLPPPDAAVSCFVRARNELMLNERTAFLLCRNAGSDAPVQCYQAARSRTRLLDWQITTLCRCAASGAPVACFERGAKTTFLIDDQLVLLCSATATQQVRGNCVPYD